MRRLLVATLALGTLTAKAEAQTCSNVNAADACAVANDVFQYMAPQLGTSLTGGSHTLGIGTNLGGFPHFAVAVRANAVQGGVPELPNIGFGPAQTRSLSTSDSPIGLPTVDFALGLTKGFNLGVTRLGGIDLIGGLTYVPELDLDGVSIAPQDGNIAIGLGARVGLLEQSALIPGVAFSYLKRDLPTVDMGLSSGGGDSFNINNFSVKTTSWRISAQKNFLIFQLSAGYGSDTYNSSTDISATVTEPGFPSQTATLSTSQDLTRTTMYGGLGINLFLFKAVAEVGQVSGGTVTTQNDFDTPADAKRNYATLGIRISF